MMSYEITVGIKGEEKDVDALRQLFNQAVKGDSSSEEIEDFFGEIGLNENPLEKNSREFSIPEGDQDLSEEIDDPYTFFNALARTFPQLGFFCIGYVDTDDGNGVEYAVYKGGKRIAGENNFYYGSECGGYACTHVPADAYAEFVKTEYALWRIEDGDDKDAIEEAQKAVRKAQGQWQIIYDFLLDGGIDRLETFRNTLRVLYDGDIEALCLLEEEGGYDGYSITNIKTIDFSEDWDGDKLPDLSRFTGLKTLNLTGLSEIITELPPYIIEKVKAGELEVIGFEDEE
jgi:hypothetical protein